MTDTQLNEDDTTPRDRIHTSSPSSSPLLNLPPELRDEIYTHAASLDPHTSRLTFSPNSELHIHHHHHHHSLLLVNKQTRREYTRLLLLLSHGITTTISDFDFRPLASYLASLPATYLASLPKQTAPIDYMTVREECSSPEARVEVLVGVTGGPSLATVIESLRNWQTQQARLESRGLRLRMSYRVRGPANLQLELGHEIVISLLGKYVELQGDITSAELMGITRALLWQVAVAQTRARGHSDSSSAVVEEHEYLLASMMIAY